MPTLHRTHAQLLEALESLTLEPGEFHHHDHIRVAWHLLATEAFEEAVQRFATALGRLTAYFGAPGKYHETITMFYLHLVRAQMCRLPLGHDWPEFVSHNPQLFTSHEELLHRFYSKPVLLSPAARQHFVLPDKVAFDITEAPAR